jgi:hypothetical protein
VAIHHFSILKQKSPKATWLMEILGNVSKFFLKKLNRHISRKRIMKLSSNNFGELVKKFQLFSSYF